LNIRFSFRTDSMLVAAPGAGDDDGPDFAGTGVDMGTSEKGWGDARSVKRDVSKNPASGQLKAISWARFLLLPNVPKRGESDFFLK
jgi:hypothetical protein